MTNDITPGTIVPAIEKNPTTETLFMYSAATWNVHKVHYDHLYSLSEGHTGVLVHGSSYGSWMAELVGRWIGPPAWIQRVRFRVHSSGHPGQTMRVTGEVSKVEVSEDGKYRHVECATAVTGPSGVLSTGTVVIAISSDQYSAVAASLGDR